MEHVSKNIVQATEEAIAHGCNTEGIMGAGAAEDIRSFYPPRMYDRYLDLCASGAYRPGDVMPWKDPSRPVLFNLAIQKQRGKNARLLYVEQSLQALSRELDRRGIHTLAITPVGTNNGGLSPHHVEALIGEHIAETTDVFIYTNG